MLVVGVIGVSDSRCRDHRIEGGEERLAHRDLEPATQGLSFRRGYALGEVTRKVDVRLPKKEKYKLPWREAGPPKHHDDQVDSDQ